MLSAALLLAAVTGTPAGAACPKQPANELLKLDYDAFDASSRDRAWRSLLNKGCVDAAVATLQAYRAENSKRLTLAQLDEMSFHIGQALAFSGRDRDSLPHFEAAKGPESSAEWSAYVDATVGFLRKNRPLLTDALERYEKLSGPTSMRLSVIRGFLRCFDRPYMEAVHCGM